MKPSKKVEKAVAKVKAAANKVEKCGQKFQTATPGSKAREKAFAQLLAAIDEGTAAVDEMIATNRRS